MPMTRYTLTDLTGVVYDLNYHCVFAPKFRRDTLRGRRATRLEEILEVISAQNGWRVRELKIVADHVHFFVATQPRYSPLQIIKRVKGFSAIKMWREFPQDLAKIYWRRDKHLFWSNGYYVGSAGDGSAATIKYYLGRWDHDFHDDELGGSDRVRHLSGRCR